MNIKRNIFIVNCQMSELFVNATSQKSNLLL